MSNDILSLGLTYEDGRMLSDSPYAPDDLSMIPDGFLDIKSEEF